MLFEWDENKRQANIAKHGIDFLDADQVIDAAHVLIPSDYGGSEPRWLAVGRIAGRYVTMIFTIRGEACRVISMRRATNAERRIYEDLHQ